MGRLSGRLSLRSPTGYPSSRRESIMGSARDNFERMEQENRRADSEHNKSDRELLKESVQRARRTETRVTMIVEHLGLNAGGEKPRFHAAGNLIQVPSRK